MTKLFLGNTGVGKTRYLYSEIKKRLLEGKKCMLVSLESSDKFLKNNKTFLEDNNDNDSMKLIIYNTDPEIYEPLLFINNAKSKEIDCLFLDDILLDDKILSDLSNIDLGELEIILISNPRSNPLIKSLKDKSYDNFFYQFDQVDILEKEENIKLTNIYFEEGNLINEKIKYYGIDALKNCDFSDDTVLEK